jgi:surface antigen
MFVISIVAIGYQPQQANGESANITSLPTAKSPTPADPSAVDQVTATHIASSIAKTTNLPIAANVANLSISLDAKSQLSQSDDALISKPQIVQSTAGSRTIITHTAKAGDTVESIASQYHVSTQTIKWANRLTTDTVNPDSKVIVPPVDGVVYTVKAGDTTDSIATKYASDAKRIVSFNDLELSNVKEGQQIVLPGGILPTEERPEYIAPVAVPVVSTSRFGMQSSGGSYRAISSPIIDTSGGNAYAFGNCTWWAYERRVQLGHPVGSFWGNATTWDTYARSAGYLVDHTPAPGAVFQMKAFVDAYTGGYGHVGIVESVSGDGSVNVSEMNYAGNFNRVTYRTIPAGQAAIYNYIH